ncbi:MAG: replication initiator protein transcriptional regulator of replication and housekeeping s [Pseudomonadota bacterium]|jgi:chromosomal replication initiator protein
MVWTDCLNALRDELPDNVYTLWIRPLHADVQGDTLYLMAPNPYFTRHITEHFLSRITTLVQQCSGGRVAHVEVRVDSRPGLSAGLARDAVVPQQRVDRTTFHDQASAAEPAKTAAGKAVGRSLNPLFTFAHFVEGRSNQMAADTCRKLLVALGDAQHNPLFLYGPTGLGKTHLMHAVGHELLRDRPHARVMYMTSEQFVGGFVGALQQGKIESFKKECRSLDLLLVDDIHLLAGKEASLVEFFHIFNSLLDESRQIILTSDRYPKELTELDPRLISRFSWGLSVGVEPPDLETRLEILLKKAENSDVHLPRNCALFMAQQVMANVRELEGALNKVIATARFKGQDISLEIIRESLKDVLAIRARTISIENIQRVVVEYFRIPSKELTGPKRTRIYARPRQMAMGLARELTGESFPDIGLAFGGRDHSTVMHACEKVLALRKTDPAFAEDYHNLLRLLQA